MYIWSSMLVLPLVFGLGLCPTYFLTFDYSITYIDALIVMTLAVWGTVLGGLYVLFGVGQPRSPAYLAELLITVSLQVLLWIALRMCESTYPETAHYWFVLTTAVTLVQWTRWVAGFSLFA